MDADKGITTRYVSGGIFYNTNYYANIGFYLSSDGKTLTVAEVSINGYAYLAGVSVIGFK